VVSEQVELVTLERAESLQGKLKMKINWWPFKNKKEKELKLVDEDYLKNIIEHLDLEPPQQQFIKARWLKYVMWWDKRSKEAKGPYHRLRATAAIAGVVTAALVGVNLGGVEKISCM